MPTIRIAQRRRFVTIANETADDNRLSLRARGLLLWLLSKPDNWKINSRMICEIVPEGRDAILTALKELEALGYIRHEKVQMPGGQWVTHTFLYESPGTGNQDSVDQDSVSQDVRDQELRTKTENKTHSLPLDGDAFDDFYKSYPRKIGRTAAQKAWKKIHSKDYLLVMLGLSMWAQYWAAAKTEEQFIPHPATWLNGRRWEDEVGMPPQPPTPPKNDGPRWDERRQIWLAPGVG